MSDAPQCPDCQELMEIGFLPYQEDAAVCEIRWYPGEVEYYSLFGVRSSNIKTDSAKYRKVTSYRCPKCGLLRSYAR
jgi:hypothetical protein